MRHLRPCALALILAVAGCGADLSPRVRVGEQGVTRPATRTELYDGSYQGRVRLVRAIGPACPRWPGYGVVVIGDATLYYPYEPDLNFAAPVTREGTMHDRIGPAVLDGRIAGNQLAFTIKTPQCQSYYRMHFVWNHS